MKNKDTLKQELNAKFSQALKSENSEGITDAFVEFVDSIQQEFINDFKTYQTTNDQSIIQKRGIRQLTTQETEFYQAVIKAGKTGDIKQAFTGLDTAYPETVIDAVIEDIRSTNPLLGFINFTNTSTLTKVLVNKKGVQLAVWGALSATIATELSGAVEKIELTQKKLTAFIPIAKDMLNAGPVWVDAYIRAVLVEANASAIEKAIVTGTGKDEPIGMDRSVADDVTVTAGVYPQKTAITVNDLKPATIGAIAKTLATGTDGRYRAVPEILMVVNPADYFTKVMPLSTVISNGAYVNNVFPYPMNVVQSAYVDEGSAIFGLASKYFMGIGTSGTGGAIDFSDEVKFLDDERVYITKFYGNGQALDDNAFVLADISGMTVTDPAVIVSEVKGTVKTKEQA